MKKTLQITISALFGILLLSGCAEDNYNAGYNSYDNRSSYDRHMDNAAEDAVYDASQQLSAQDIKNINNLK